MILLPGTTRCPACGQPVYPTDDLFPVRGRSGGPAVVDGFYHYRCFAAAPFRGEHLAALRPRLEAGLGPPDARTLLGRTADFAVTREADLEQYRLHALAHGRWLELSKPALVAALGGVMAGVGGSRFRITPVAGGADLYLPSPVAVHVRFTDRDFARLRQHLPPLGRRPSEPVNLAELCDRLGVLPAAISCPLSAASGGVMRTEEDDGGEFTLVATRWQEIDATADHLGQLRTLADKVLLAL